MTITVSTIDESTRDAYAAYISSHPQARFGHDLEWAEALHKTYGVQTRHLIARQDGKITGACPLFLGKSLFGGAHYQTSVFPSYFGPLYDDETVLAALIDAIKEKTGQVDFGEILAPSALPEDATAGLFSENVDVTYSLPIEPDVNKILAGFTGEYKRILRKPPAPSEFEIIVDEDGAYLDQFYKLYVKVYAGKHGFIPHIKKLFSNIMTCYPRGSGRIYLAKAKGEFIGGVFTIWTHKEAYYAWSAVLPIRAYRPAHYIIWRIIQDAARQGYLSFNMGESQVENEGLISFKRGWGTQASHPRRYFVPGGQKTPTERLYDKFDWTKKVISMLPGRVVASFVSPLIRFFL